MIISRLQSSLSPKLTAKIKRRKLLRKTYNQLLPFVPTSYKIGRSEFILTRECIERKVKGKDSQAVLMSDQCMKRRKKPV